MIKKMKASIGIWALIYVFIGINLYFKNVSAFIMYITVFPFHLFMLKYSINKHNFTLTCVSSLLLISQGINSFMFFLNEKDYAATGFKAVGNFQFNVIEYFKAYSYVFIFSLSILLFTRLILRGNISITFKYINTLLSDRKDKHHTSYKHAELLILTICIFASYLSIIMYNNQLGIRGMTQAELPFHLTGILYYFREIVISGILLLLYVKSRNKNRSCIYIFSYLFIAGFASVSRSLVGIIVIPIICESFISGRKKRSLVAFIYYCIVFWLVTKARNYVYVSTGILYTYNQLITLSFSNFFSDFFDIFFYLVNEISARLYGCQSVILGAQYDKATFDDLVKYYYGANFSTIVPNMIYSMFGIVVPKGMSFGVSLGYIGQMVLLANHNYLLILLQAFLMAGLFGLQEKTLRYILIHKETEIVKIGAIACICFSMIVFWLGLPMVLFYTLIIVLIMIKKFGNSKSVNIKKHFYYGVRIDEQKKIC